MEKPRELTKGLPLLCQSCGHRWRFRPEIGTHIEAFIALMRANCICPRCGNRSRASGKGVLITQRRKDL